MGSPTVLSGLSKNRGEVLYYFNNETHLLDLFGDG